MFIVTEYAALNVFSLQVKLSFDEGHLESSKHGIITPQCVDKMLLNNTFSETRIQGRLDDLLFCRKKTWHARAAHAQNE